MAKRYGQHCPVAKSLDLVGERWTLLIVRDLLRAPARFQDLRAQLSGIPPKLLAERLRRMERQGLVTRELYSKRPPRASYALTERGRAGGVGPSVRHPAIRPSARDVRTSDRASAVLPAL